MIPDRVHCSWRETAGLMAALKFTRLRMIEPQIILFCHSLLISDHTTALYHYLCPLPVLYHAYHFTCYSWCNPMIFQQINLRASPERSCKCKHVGSHSEVAPDFTLSFFGVVVTKQETGSSSWHQTAALTLSDKKRKKLSLQARRQAFMPHWEFVFAVQPHRTRLKDKCCCVTASFTRVHNGAVWYLYTKN